MFNLKDLFRHRSWLVQGLLTCLLVGFSSLALAKPVPYLQSATPNSIWVSWKTTSGSDSLVEYGVTAEQLEHKVSGNVQTLASDYLYHSVQLTGLKAETRYFYRVTTGNQQSATYSFMTPPVAGKNDGKLRILVMGDHQIRNENRYAQLVNAAKNKIEDLYGEPIEQALNLILNDGDQVDVGTLDHYENLHFAQSSAISPNVPIMTTVGNHEYYYDGNLANYQAHFIYDGLSYQGIAPASDESYYSYQVGRVLFVHLNSMRTDATQQQWLSRVIAAADQDQQVDWIISIIHHPYQAEQYVGDISKTLRDSWMAILSSTRKHVLNIGGHHHLYARGQTREWPTYHMISGGTAWDQYWGQSSEVDFDDVQKTIANWAWQLIEIDVASRQMKVDTYAEAHPIVYKTEGFHLHSKLIDSFQRRLDGGQPNQPAIQNEITAPVALPYDFVSSSFSSAYPDGLNSTQFQIADDAEFKQLRVDRIRDIENIFGDTGAPLYEPVDLHANVDIMTWQVPAYGLPNGQYFVRVRHRDSNMEWSPWSDSVSFEVQGSSSGDPALKLDNNKYASGAMVKVGYSGGRGNPTDWIGIYKAGDKPQSVRATKWQYVPTPAGELSFTGLTDGEYFVAFFEKDSYEEIAPRQHFYMGPLVSLSMEKSHFAEQEQVNVNWQGSGAGSKDWIGIYRVGQTPGGVGSTKWQYTTSAEGTATFSGLAKGYYFATFMINDGYTEIAERIAFSVGAEIASVSLDKQRFEQGEAVQVHFSNGPGIAKDYIGVFRQGAIPGQTGSELVTYLYFDGAVAGTVNFEQGFEPGQYFLAMYTNDSYDQVSNRACFVVGNGPLCGAVASLSVGQQDYETGQAVVFSWSDTPGNSKDWLGVYKIGQEPQSDYATKWQYLSDKQGSLSISGLTAGDYYGVVLLNDGYQEATSRVTFSVKAAVMAGDLDGDGQLTMQDAQQLRAAFGRCEGDEGYLPGADLQADGCINFVDYGKWLALFRQQ